MRFVEKSGRLILVNFAMRSAHDFRRLRSDSRADQKRINPLCVCVVAKCNLHFRVIITTSKKLSNIEKVFMRQFQIR